MVSLRLCVVSLPLHSASEHSTARKAHEDGALLLSRVIHLGHQRLARPRGAAKKRPLGDLGADLLELVGVAEKLDKLGDLDLGLGQTGDVLEPG